MRLLLLILFPLSLTAQVKELNHSGIEPVKAFVHSLNDAQIKKGLFPFDEMNRYEWHYLPAAMVARNGIGVKELDSNQKQLLYIFLQAFLSKQGFVRTRNIMDMELVLKELEPNNPIRIPENYFISIYGWPEKDSTWGWKFSGHHVALNFTLVGDQLAFAPFFFGAYPAEVKTGPKKGMRILKDEEDLGFQLIRSMTSKQKKAAIFQLKAFTDIVTTNAAEVGKLDGVGIHAGALTADQNKVLNDLIEVYLKSMPSEVANRRIKRMATEDRNEIRFGWAGEQEMGKPHYYRVQGKTFLIEFDNTQAQANHIHTVWRDFNGDFGRDLIREHYHTSKHDQ